jgi:hypothetical protein
LLQIKDNYIGLVVSDKVMRRKIVRNRQFSIALNFKIKPGKLIPLAN